jgi:aminobenzoyl-glutamate utilization protein B
VLTATDQPAIHRNEEAMQRLRPAMEKDYYDPSRFPTYLDQLGVRYSGGGASPAAPAK